MTAVGWTVWVIALVSGLFLIVELFYQRKPSIVALNLVMLPCLGFGLFASVYWDISKFHLLWYVPAVWLVVPSMFGLALHELDKIKSPKVADKGTGDTR